MILDFLDLLTASRNVKNNRREPIPTLVRIPMQSPEYEVCFNRSGRVCGSPSRLWLPGLVQEIGQGIF